ncbi:MAG TPA: thioredoxin domain-containing protein [Candidatus Limnocylindria bacterium]|nr:thioredoxin domain-containing protein [Candidatus Limnocylindria bacterium]
MTLPSEDLGTHEASRSGEANRLIREKSPYLLQHAHNPVDWYPWDEEAFAKARREGMPIFLSIGYSTCHWCHVMERESFEDGAVAALLNRDFVAIKVDREERPDVDRIYMTAAQALGLGGGWPLNMFLAPDLTPFYGGTYFPPRTMSGRPGMIELLPHVARAWQEHRAELEQTGERVFESLAGLALADSLVADRARLFAHAFDRLAQSHDELGGFGRAPKFPSVVNLNFLQRYAERTPERRDEARAMVLRQLDRMQAGGIHDHLGGGFHRYSTDREWLVPHFEKMLYDQAQLAWAYLEGFQVTGEARYAETAGGIFTYVARDLTSPEGAFYSAEDADSEGEEGRFYVWSGAQIEAVLGSEDAALVIHHYGVTPEGNFEHGTTILNEVHARAETARRFALAPEALAARLSSARSKLLDARSRRPRPHRDDKVLTAWNGLMISSSARGARVLGEPELARRAAKAAEFVWSTLRDPRTGELHRRWRDGETAGRGQLDDYAYYALGLLDLYQATFDPMWLERAVAVTEAQVSRFWDEQDGGFFESPPDDPSIRVRMKDGFDGAEMAGNSIAALALLRLARLLDRREWIEKGDRMLDYYARRLDGMPVAMPQMLVAMDLAQSPPRHIVIAGAPAAEDTRALLAELDRRFRPHDELVMVDDGNRSRLAALAPFAAALGTRDGKATAYVCENYTCRLPTTDPHALADQLDNRPQPITQEQQP